MNSCINAHRDKIMKIKHFVINLFTFATIYFLTYYSIFENNFLCKNALLFISTVILFTMMIIFSLSCKYTNLKNDPNKLLNKTEKSQIEIYEKCLKTYIDGKHLPKWFGIILYIPIIATLASYGWFYTATCWVIVSTVDLGVRNESKKYLKENK